MIYLLAAFQTTKFLSYSMNGLNFAKKYIITKHLVQQMIFVIASSRQIYMQGTASVFRHGKNDNIA